jgi:hypothetical protein
MSMTQRTGRVDLRFNVKTGKYRMRFHGVAPDQKETILAALERACAEASSTFDSVALEAICMNYLSGGNVT